MKIGLKQPTKNRRKYMLRTLGLILIMVGNLLMIPGTFKKYKKTRDRLDLLELVCLIIMVPSLLILVIGQFI